MDTTEQLRKAQVYIYIYMTESLSVQQELTQHCKINSTSIKKKRKKGKVGDVQAEAVNNAALLQESYST